jgi:predicted nucleic acid-binding protein
MASERRPAVLLDANVIFSGFGGSGPPHQILGVAGDSFSLLVTDEVISEVLRNIARKAPFVLVEVKEWFESVSVQVWEVLPTALREYEARFGKDAHIVAAAIAVQPDYVCTGDIALRDGINALSESPKALSPRELLDLLTL